MKNELFKLKSTNSTVVIEFVGRKVGMVSSRGSKPRWTELHGYITEGGNYVVEKIGMSDIEGEMKRVTVYNFRTLESMMNKIGTGSLALDLYQVMGIEQPTIRID